MTRILVDYILERWDFALSMVHKPDDEHLLTVMAEPVGLGSAYELGCVNNADLFLPCQERVQETVHDWPALEPNKHRRLSIQHIFQPVSRQVSASGSNMLRQQEMPQRCSHNLLVMSLLRMLCCRQSASSI